MLVIRKSSFTPAPWKNGGGITHEAWRVPPSGDSFRWRVSVAQIDASGPFSEFAGHLRTMVLLRGSGVALRFDGAAPTYLREIGDLVSFDGALSTECDLLAGPCTDLNFMVSKSMTGVHAWVERLQKPRALQPNRGTLVAFALSGKVALEAEGGPSERLHAWDLALMSPQDRGTLGPALADESAAPLVFFATLDDN